MGDTFDCIRCEKPTDKARLCMTCGQACCPECRKTGDAGGVFCGDNCEQVSYEELPRTIKQRDTLIEKVRVLEEERDALCVDVEALLAQVNDLCKRTIEVCKSYSAGIPKETSGEACPKCGKTAEEPGWVPCLCSTH